MKKASKVFAVIVVIAIVGIAGFVGYIKTFLPNVGEAPEMKVDMSPQNIERGKYLANHVMLCMDCHSTRDWSKFSGPPVPGTEGVGGEVFDQKFGFPGFFMSRNITPHGLKDWTDGEIFRALTTGVSKDGSALFPIMPYKYYREMDEGDIKAVIAYIRTLPAIESTTAPSKPDFPFNIILNTLPQKAALKAMPSKSNSVEYGKYIATAAGCAECHTKQEKGEIVGKPFAGGFEFNLPNGTVVRSPNITPDESGIGAWSKESFVQRFKMYADSSYVAPTINFEKKEFQTVMPWIMYSGMEQGDLEALYDYLQTLKPVRNKIERFSTVAVR
jgi:hypothetical protein